MFKIGLVNPGWQLDETSLAFTCPEPHPPLAFLYALTLLKDRPEASGFLVDAHLRGWSHEETIDALVAQQPDIVVLATAPGYSAWKTPPADLSIPTQLIKGLREALPGVPLLACGPHGSSHPDEALAALACDGIIRGEPEEVLAELGADWKSNSYIFQEGKHPWNVDRAVVTLEDLPAIDYSLYPLQAATHHHRFLGPLEADMEAEVCVPSIDVEWSRGCQYSCTFCNRIDFRNKYRERSIEAMITELVTLKQQGVAYVNFSDDLFGLGKTPDLLIEMRQHPVPAFGIQTRVDLWDEKSIDFLAAAGCRHIEFGLESPLPEIQKLFNREYKHTIKRTEEVILHAVSKIKSVVVTLLQPEELSIPQQEQTSLWREKLLSKGCWVTAPLRVYPYPSTHYFKQRVAAEPITAQGDWDKAQKFYNATKAPLS